MGAMAPLHVTKIYEATIGLLLSLTAKRFGNHAIWCVHGILQSVKISGLLFCALNERMM